MATLIYGKYEPGKLNCKTIAEARSLLHDDVMHHNPRFAYGIEVRVQAGYLSPFFLGDAICNFEADAGCGDNDINICVGGHEIPAHKFNFNHPLPKIKPDVFISRNCTANILVLPLPESKNLFHPALAFL